MERNGTVMENINFAHHLKHQHWPQTSVYLWKANETDSSDILSIRKYYQLFTHESNTFLGEQYIILPIQTNGGANAEKSQRHVDPTHEAKRQLDLFTHFHTTMQQSPQWLW